MNNHAIRLGLTALDGSTWDFGYATAPAAQRLR
jgi:hypothetical protein